MFYDLENQCSEKRAQDYKLKQGYLGPEAMNLIKTDLITVINFEPFVFYWTNWVI